MIYNVLVLMTVKLIFKKDFYRFVIARNYLSECCAEVPVQDGDIRKSRTHLLPQPYWAYSYIWKNFLSKNLKSGWMMTTHWANKKKNTSKIVGEAGMQPHHKPHHCCSNPQCRRNSKPGASSWGAEGSKPTSGIPYAWDMSP